MGTAITDLLIELSDPRRYAEFQRDPEVYLADRRLAAKDLTAQDKSALLSRDSRKIRKYARSTESTDPTQQFNRFTKSDVVVDQMGVVAVDVVNPTEGAVDGQGVLYVDGNGTFYRAKRA